MKYANIFINVAKPIQLGMQIGDVACEPKEFLLKTITIARIRDGAAIMPADRTPKAMRLLGTIEDAKKVPVRVYTTDVSLRGVHCTLSTGSKEIHLELGRMGWEAREALVDLIDHETKIGSELLVVFQQEGSAKGLICTKQLVSDSMIRITLSVAND